MGGYILPWWLIVPALLALLAIGAAIAAVIGGVLWLLTIPWKFSIVVGIVVAYYVVTRNEP